MQQQVYYSGGSRLDKGGGAVIQALGWGGGAVSIIFFWPFEPQFGLVAKYYFRSQKKRSMLIVIIEKKNYHVSRPPKYRAISIWGISERFDCILPVFTRKKVRQLTRRLMKHDASLWLIIFSCCDWFIIFFFALLMCCSHMGSLLYGSSRVFLDRGQPSFWNFYIFRCASPCWCCYSEVL